MSTEVPDGATQRHARLTDMLTFIATYEPHGCSLTQIQAYMVTAWGLKFKTTAEMIREYAVAGLVKVDGHGMFHLTAELTDLLGRLEKLKHQRLMPASRRAQRQR